MPPVAESAALYGVFAVPPASELVTICKGTGAAGAAGMVGVVGAAGALGAGGALTTRLRAPLVAVCGVLDESAAVTVKEYVPLAVGVPPITPAEDMTKPGAREPEARLQEWEMCPL